MVQIEGSCFLLRPWRRGDETSLVEHANDRDVWINLTDGFPHPYTLEDARAWIAQAQAAGNSWIPLAIEIDDGAAGGIGLKRREDVYARTAGIDVTILPLGYLFARGPGWPMHLCGWFDRIWCGTALQRWASGFKAVARKPK